MSPRSLEYLTRAQERLRAAQFALTGGFAAVAVSAAYYAALYAARAALSEDDRNARTHRGTWHLFRELYVAPGRFDARLLSEVTRFQELREAGDYDAREISSEEAERAIAAAEAFVAAVDAMLQG